MSNALFQVRKESGDIVGNYPTLVEAVLQAAQFDGYGAEYVRDETGTLWLCRSARPIGNYLYTPNIATDRFSHSSSRDREDSKAQEELAGKVYYSDVIPSRLYLEVVELIYSDTGLLQYVDQQSIEEVAYNSGKTEEAVRASYDINKMVPSNRTLPPYFNHCSLTRIELLSLATVALGLPADYYLSGNDWNPMDDNAHAFQLAVELGMQVSIELNMHRSIANSCYEFHVRHYDRDSATRYAIVRAAAEIGLTMKGDICAVHTT